MAPCIDSLPPLAFTNRRPIPTMLHPPSPLAIRAQDAQRFIVFSYFVPAECPVATEATGDVSAGKREDLSTDTHLSSMLHRYLPHFFNDDSIPPQQTEGTTEVSVAPVAISNIKEEDRFYPFSLPPLAQRFIGNSFNVPETSQLAVSATECRVANVATAGTATVKRENRWEARILPSVQTPCLPPVFDDDFMPPEHTVEDAYEVSFVTEATSGTATVDGVDRSAAKCPVPMLPPSLPGVFDIDNKLSGAAAEGTNKCPVASETTNDVSTHLKEDMAADQSPPDPAALPPSSPYICDSDHKLTKEEKEDATESSLATEITAGNSIVQGEDLDKSPAPRLPPSLSHILDNVHKQPEETIEGATECSVAAEASVANREDPSAANPLHTVLPSSLQLVFDNDYKWPAEAVEGASKCPFASESAASVSTVLQEEFLTHKSPPAPAALPLRLHCTHNNDHKQPEETVKNTTECSVDIEACAVASTVKREELTGDKSPVHALPPSLECIHDKDHKQPDQKGRGTTVELDICPHAHQLVSDANLTLATRNDELPTPLICVVTKTPVRVGASICRSEDEEPRPWTLEEAKDYCIGIEIESEERSVKEMSPKEGLKHEADCAHSKCSNGMVSSERAVTILGRVGFLVMNPMKKIPFLKMKEKEENKKLNKKLKDDEKERKEMKDKEEEQKKREKKEMNEREKEQKKVMKAEKKREKLEQKKSEKESKEKEKAEKKRLEGLMKIHNAMMKDRIKKEKKCYEELKKREKAQAEFLEMERKIQVKEEKKREKMRKEERKRLEKKKKREPAGGGTERVIEVQGRDESLKMDE
ncbi:titin homolog [Salmo salar]|uniref:Titin homolog n=1 Tax=Salmo salar TaxID=8030 RepID=A0ABM3D1U2_SALSA|nr:titin homolog [Salmo salar]